MASRRSKRIVQKDERISIQGKKRGRKSEKDHIKTIIDAYMEGNQKEVRDQINSWEHDLRDNLRYIDIPMEEWERMVQDLGTMNGRQSLFKKTLHEYWIMKNVVARAMTLHREHMEGEVFDK